MYKSRRNRVKKETRYLGLKRNTYLTVLTLLAFIIVVALIGHAFRLQEKLVSKFQNKSQVYAQQIKTLTTYKRPTIDLTGKAKAEMIIKKVWRSDWRIGMALSGCESGYREKVVNSIGATGYFQVLAPVHGVPVDELQNGWVNAGYAYSLFKEQNLQPWISSKECWSERI